MSTTTSSSQAKCFKKLGDADTDSVMEQALTHARHSEEDGILGEAKETWDGVKEAMTQLARESHSTGPDNNQRFYGTDCLVSVSWFSPLS